MTNPMTEPAVVLEHIEYLSKRHGAAAVARSIGVSATALSFVRSGKRPPSPKLVERLLAIYPLSDAPTAAKRSGEQKQNPEIVWLNTTQGQLDDLLAKANRNAERIDPVDRYHLHPSTVSLFRAIRSAVHVDSDLTEVLPEPPSEGPALEVAKAAAAIEAKLLESEEHQANVDPSKSSELWRRFSAFRLAWQNKLKKLTATETAAELIDNPVCGLTVAELSRRLRPLTDARARAVEAIRNGDEHWKYYAAQLDRIRAIEFPGTDYRNDPVGFAYYILGCILWDGQVEIAEDVRDNKDTTVSTGQKIGKTVLVAILCLWWYCVWSDGYAIITNATGKQLERQDWMWVKRLFRGSGICYDCKKVGVKTRPCPHSQVIDGILLESSSGGLRSEDDQRWIIGTTAKIPDDVGGYSGEHLLVVNDEASKLAQDIYEAWLGNTGADGAKMLLLGNPLGQTGPFRAANTSSLEEKHWKRRVISSIRAAQWNLQAKDKIPGLMSMDRIERIRDSDELGDKSPAFMVRILGEYPTIDESCIYPIDMVIEAQDEERYKDTEAEGKTVISIDPAGEELSGDAVVFCVRRGLKVLEFKSFKGLRLDDYLYIAIDLAKKWRLDPNEQILLAIDADGIGSRVVVRFQNYMDSRRTAEHEKIRFDVHPVYFGHQAVDWEVYDLTGDEAYAYVSRWLKRGGVFPENGKLQQEMQHARWWPVRKTRYDNEGERLSGTRKDGVNGWRKLIGRSPDHLDSLKVGMLAEERLGYAPEEERSPEQKQDEESAEGEEIQVSEVDAFRNTIAQLRRGNFS